MAAAWYRGFAILWYVCDGALSTDVVDPYTRIFAVIECPLRPYTAPLIKMLGSLSPAAPASAPPASSARNSMPSLHGPTSVPSDESGNPATWASKAAAGFLASVTVLTPLYALRAAGVNSLPAVAGLSAACTVAGAFMPNVEKLERMF
jgi:hypothetical protein